MIESGVKDFLAASYVGVLAPAKTPPDVVAMLEKALVKALADKASQDKFLASGAELVPEPLQTSKGFGDYIKAGIRTPRRRRSRGSSRNKREAGRLRRRIEGSRKEDETTASAIWRVRQMPTDAKVEGCLGRSAIRKIVHGLELQCMSRFRALLGEGAHAEDKYPSRPVRMVVPFSAGGPTDIVARVMGAKMAELLGQQFVVENKVGAGGNIGADVVAKSPPDGYTLLMATVSTHAINPGLYSRMPYDPVRDFAPVAQVGRDADAARRASFDSRRPTSRA